MVLLRHFLGDALRRLRLRQGRTLREVSAAARVSLGYLSEVERGQKEASSELLASICGALGAPLSQVLREVSDNFALAELQNEPVLTGAREPWRENAESEARTTAAKLPGGAATGRQVTIPVGSGLAATAPSRNLAVPAGQRLVAAEDQVLDETVLRADQPMIEQVTRRACEITNMVPV
jgi:transcriptional regulator with XRE-family HTH domain